MKGGVLVSMSGKTWKVGVGLNSSVNRSPLDGILVWSAHGQPSILTLSDWELSGAVDIRLMGDTVIVSTGD